MRWFKAGSSRGLFRAQVPGPHPGDADSGGQGWGPGMCKSPDDAEAASWGPHFDSLCLGALGLRSAETGSLCEELNYRPLKEMPP